MPEEPSQTSVDIVRWFAIVGGALELLAGAVMLGIALRRGPLRPPQEAAATRRRG